MPNNSTTEVGIKRNERRSWRCRPARYALILIATLAACGGVDSADTEAGAARTDGAESSPASPDVRGTDTPEPSASGSREVPTSPEGQGAGMIRSEGDTARVTARISEYKIQMGQDTIESGGTALLIRNEGERPHTIELRAADGMRWRTIPIPPGGAVTMSMLLSPGAYTVSSVTPAYVDRGMTASLHVR